MIELLLGHLNDTGILANIGAKVLGVCEVKQKLLAVKKEQWLHIERALFKKYKEAFVAF